MIDYEEMILEMVDDDGGMLDECATCHYKGVDTCKGQCERIEEVYNPYLTQNV